MLKRALSDLETIDRATELIKDVLKRVPFVTIEHINREVRLPAPSSHYADLDLGLQTESGRSYRVICEVKAHGQPRQVRAGAAQLRHYISLLPGNAYGVFIAPYLSPPSQQICNELGIGFLDFEGNCRLVFDGIFIERLSEKKSAPERREFRSIFAPKSAQVLRVLLKDPHRSWRVADLAHEAGVSIGHVSNVRNALLDREWVDVKNRGISLTRPDALLDAWRDTYQALKGRRTSYYTTLHGEVFQRSLKAALNQANRVGSAILSSFSAAQWLAPFARTGMQYFYADKAGSEALQDLLRFSPASKGENVVVTVLDADGVFRDAIEPVPELRCTSAVQTYLDLWISGERGREAAEFLRKEKLRWQ